MSDPPYLQALKGEMPIMKMGWFQNYKAAWIDTGRFRPIVHIIVGIMTIGYTLEFATHLRRAPLPPPPLPPRRASCEPRPPLTDATTPAGRFAPLGAAQARLLRPPLSWVYSLAAACGERRGAGDCRWY